MLAQILIGLYLCVAIGIGAVVWRHTRHTWTRGRLGSHVARAVVLTVALGAAWPGTILVAWAYESPSGRRFIDRSVFGRSSNDDDSWQ